MPGGRAGLIRIAAILGNSYLSFPIPDYTAYSEMLSLFKNVSLARGAVRNMCRSFNTPIAASKD